jgi:hypothetical protein
MRATGGREELAGRIATERSPGFLERAPACLDERTRLTGQSIERWAEIVKLRKRYLPLAAVLGAAVAIVPAFAAAPSEAKLEVNENCVQSDWPCWATPDSGSNPAPASKVTIAAGGEVMFTDDASTAANIAWTGTAPTCSSGVPVSPTAPKTDWEGKCKFEQPGTYKFESSTLFNEGGSLDYTKYEIVVESAAVGTTPTTTTTTTTPTTTTTTPSEPSHGSPLEGGSRALKLAGSQRGSTVRGSINVSQAGSGGRLEVGLFAAGASLAKAGHAQQVRVGRLVRSSLQAGNVSFSVPLSARGKAALRRHHRLGLTVKITLTPLHGAAVTVTRGVVIRA